MYFPPLVWDNFYQCLQLIFWVVWHRGAKCDCGLFLFFFFIPPCSRHGPSNIFDFTAVSATLRQARRGKKEGGRETEDDTGRWGVAALTLSSTFKWDFSQTQETGKSNPEPEEPAYHALWISRGGCLAESWLWPVCFLFTALLPNLCLCSKD